MLVAKHATLFIKRDVSPRGKHSIGMRWRIITKRLRPSKRRIEAFSESESHVDPIDSGRVAWSIRRQTVSWFHVKSVSSNDNLYEEIVLDVNVTLS